MLSIPARNYNTVNYPGIGRCIYCGKQDCKLTKEHIILYALGGNLILKDASCEECAAITSAFERAVARELFGDFRTHFNLPTRRPKKRPKEFKIKNNGGSLKEQSISVSDFPSPAFMYACTEAGILKGLSPDLDTSPNWQMIALVNDNEMQAFQEKYGKNTLFSFRHVPEQFARTLAKIGYTYAIATIGPDIFQPLCVDLILGKSKNFSYLVGGTFEKQQPVPDAGHLLELGILTDFQKALIIVEIRLFASAPTPLYHVVVGAIDNKEDTLRLLHRIKT